MAGLIPFPKAKVRALDVIDRVIDLLGQRTVCRAAWLEIDARLRPLLRRSRKAVALEALFFHRIDPFEQDR